MQDPYRINHAFEYKNKLSYCYNRNPIQVR